MKQIFTLLSMLLFVVACETEPTPDKQPDKTPDKDVSGIRLNYDITQARSAKRGVSFNFQLAEDVDILGKGVSWSYNWGPDHGGAAVLERMEAVDMRFYPMAWNGNFNSGRIRQWKATHPECEYILAFNEPNLTDQANMTPQQAASHWPQLKALADELGMKIIAPAMNYGTLAGYSDPIKWLDEFFQLVPISDVSGIAIHCYMASPSALKGYVQRFYKYDLPIWLTEFCAWEPSIGDYKAQGRFMAQCLGYLESDPHVAGYAWFMPRGAADETIYPYYSLLTKKQPIDLTYIGKIYVNYSSFDKSKYYAPEEVIPAESFRDCNASASSTDSEWTQYVAVQPTTDVTGILEVSDLFNGQWVEYGISCPDDKQHALWVRYTAPSDSVVEFIVGENIVRHTFAATGDGNWRTECIYLTPTAGEKVLRVNVMVGRLSLNWLRLL